MQLQITKCSSFLVALKQKGWATMATFGGEHDHLRKKMDQHLDTDEITDFMSKNYEAHISLLEKLIEAGELKSGDQLMIAFDVYGSDPKKNKKGESKHEVAVNDRQKVSLQRQPMELVFLLVGKL